MWSILVDLLISPRGVLDDVRLWRRERRVRQWARASEIICAFRVVDGHHRGLGRRWARGTARVPPGVVGFDPDSWWRSRTRIPVRSAALQPPGDIPGHRLRKIGPRPRRILLTTADATLEWLVPEEQVQRAMGVTRPDVRDVRR